MIIGTCLDGAKAWTRSCRTRLPAGPILSGSDQTQRGHSSSLFSSAVSPLTSPNSRAYSAIARQETVELSYDVVKPPQEKVKDQSLVICHGLFGSKQNWRSLSKTFAQRLGMPVYTLDLRNHGHSPHARPHDYSHMAADVGRFLSDRGLEGGVNLMGHSMGGKVVMALALDKAMNGSLRTLMVADIAPARGKISEDFQQYTIGMKEVEKAGVRTKAEADKILQAYEPTLPTRQFLLTNTMTTSDKKLGFRIPLDILSADIPAIGDFPFSPGEAQWNGPTLFVKGKHSNYINNHNIPVCEQFFPKMQLELLDAGHWVHAERPGEFVGMVEKFVAGA